MIISLIALLTIDHVIGINNMIPWIFAVDRKWFQYHTLNKPIIMGRKTFESIGKKPLLNRLNIVLSNNLLHNNHYGKVFVADTPNKALSLVKNEYEVMIIGGGMVYNIFLPWSKRLYLTYIDIIQYYGDAWFPYFDPNKWCPIFNTYYKVRDKNYCYDLNFKILERI